MLNIKEDWIIPQNLSVSGLQMIKNFVNTEEVQPMLSEIASAMSKYPQQIKTSDEYHRKIINLVGKQIAETPTVRHLYKPT